MEFRLASYNIQFGYGQDGRYCLDRIVDAVKDVDVICLQEVTTFWEACNGDHQPELLSQKLNRFSAFSPGFELDSSYADERGRAVNRRRAFGNMVLSRWPIVYSRSHALGRPPTRLPEDFPDPKTDLPRSVLETVIDTPGGVLRVMSLHLSHLPDGQRLAQIETLKQLLVTLPMESQLWADLDAKIKPWTQDKPAPPVPRASILAGDFNFRPADDEYSTLLDAPNGPELADGWRLAHGAGLPHAPTCMELDGPRCTLDYVFFTADLWSTVQDARVRDKCTGSDHFPLILELEFQVDRITSFTE